MSSPGPEAWLRGPVDGIPALLQPVAHALVQARDEVRRAVDRFPDDGLWVRPAGMAPVGFHLRHLAGVLDRLFTYARGERLDAAQLRFLEHEAVAPETATSVPVLLAAFDVEVSRALDHLRNIPEATLTEPRAVGRSGLPSTVGGLLFHAAEHTMRHTGQLIVTARIVGSAG